MLIMILKIVEKCDAQLNFLTNKIKCIIIIKNAQLLIHLVYLWTQTQWNPSTVIGVRGTGETCMGLARLIHDLHPGASAPSIQTIPDLKIGARNLWGMIYVQKEMTIHL